MTRITYATGELKYEKNSRLKMAKVFFQGLMVIDKGSEILVSEGKRPRLSKDKALKRQIRLMTFRQRPNG